MMKYTETQIDDMIVGIDDMISKLKGSCRCKAIDNKINRVIKAYSTPKQIESHTIDHGGVCCWLCCNCHMERLQEEIRESAAVL
jgi:hypothetical protein